MFRGLVPRTVSTLSGEQTEYRLRDRLSVSPDSLDERLPWPGLNTDTGGELGAAHARLWAISCIICFTRWPLPGQSRPATLATDPLVAGTAPAAATDGRPGGEGGRSRQRDRVTCPIAASPAGSWRWQRRCWRRSQAGALSRSRTVRQPPLLRSCSLSPVPPSEAPTHFDRRCDVRLIGNVVQADGTDELRGPAEFDRPKIKTVRGLVLPLAIHPGTGVGPGCMRHQIPHDKGVGRHFREGLPVGFAPFPQDQLLCLQLLHCRALCRE
jgi:hypothetical protein